MSTVKLTSIALFKGSANSATELIGASAVPSQNGVTELLMSSVPFHADSMSNRVNDIANAESKFPGLYLLYGNRDVLDERQHWSNYARKTQGVVFASVEIECEVKGICPGHVDREILKSFRDSDGNEMGFLNLRRMKASLQLEILAKFQDAIKAEGGNPDLMLKPAQIATRPDLWPQVMNEDEDFKKIDVMVIAVADDPAVPGKMRQVAWMRPKTKVASVLQSRTDIHILQPQWMKQD